jgi:antitoxin ParD1/3/4
MNVSLSDELTSFVDEQVRVGAYGSRSGFVRDLIRREQDRQRLRNLLLEGPRSPVAVEGDDAYFASLRTRARSSV